MSNSVHLGMHEKVEERPFTDPEHSVSDLERLVSMTHQLVDTYDDPVVCDFNVRKGALCQSDPQGRHFRIYYIQPEDLFSFKNISVVGFFGQQRADADIDPLIQADRKFEKIFYDFEGLLSLSTVRLPNGDFGNLVLFANDEAKDNWNFNPVHYDTVSEISPPYYSSIRLSNGVLPNGLDSPEMLKLTKVRYLDYSESPAWRGLREFNN